MDYRIEKFSLDELADEKLFRHWVLSLKKINNSYFHPKISEFNDNFQENKKMSKYSYLEGMPLHLKIEQEKKFGITMHYTQSSKKNLLEIKTSEKMLKKAYLIATQLIVGIEKLGGTLTNSWQSEIVKLELSPLKFRFIITELTKRRSLIQEGSMKPAYGRVSSGELKLEIKFDSGEKSYIYATKDISFNQQLEDIFGTIRGEYLLLRDKELEQRIAKDLENKKRLLLEDNQKLEEEKVRLQKEISESQISRLFVKSCGK